MVMYICVYSTRLMAKSRSMIRIWDHLFRVYHCQRFKVSCTKKWGYYDKITPCTCCAWHFLKKLSPMLLFLLFQELSRDTMRKHEQNMKDLMNFLDFCTPSQLIIKSLYEAWQRKPSKSYQDWFDPWGNKHWI